MPVALSTLLGCVTATDPLPARSAPTEGATPRTSDEASATGEARQRGRDVAERRVQPTSLDVRKRRERRVHQHDARRDAGIEMIVDMRRIEAGDGNGRKEQ